jgi:hypothetical protein
MQWNFDERTYNTLISSTDRSALNSLILEESGSFVVFSQPVDISRQSRPFFKVNTPPYEICDDNSKRAIDIAKQIPGNGNMFKAGRPVVYAYGFGDDPSSFFNGSDLSAGMAIHYRGFKNNFSISSKDEIARLNGVWSAVVSDFKFRDKEGQSKIITTCSVYPGVLPSFFNQETSWLLGSNDSVLEMSADSIRWYQGRDYGEKSPVSIFARYNPKRGVIQLDEAQYPALQRKVVDGKDVLIYLPDSQHSEKMTQVPKSFFER